MTKPPRKSAGGGGGSPGLALRVALAGAWHVVRGRSLGQLGRVLALLEAVGRAAPGLLRYRHAARLRLGLRAAVLMQMLREAEPDGRILDTLDWFFPEGEGAEAPPPGPAQPTPRELRLVGEAQESFRELILGLLGDPARRAEYLQLGAALEYGERFLGSLESLFHEFLRRVEAALPPPQPQLLQALVLSHAPPGPRPPDLPILSRYLSDVGHAPRVPRPAPPPQRLRPLAPRPLEFVGDPEVAPPKKARPCRSSPRPNPDGQRDRDRHRTHRQGGADQGAGGGEGGDPPPAAEAHLQREADERREDGGRLQDPGRVGAALGAGAAGGRGLGGAGPPRGAGPR